jgi:hypothetical protein
LRGYDDVQHVEMIYAGQTDLPPSSAISETVQRVRLSGIGAIGSVWSVTGPGETQLAPNPTGSAQLTTTQFQSQVQESLATISKLRSSLALDEETARQPNAPSGGLIANSQEDLAISAAVNQESAAATERQENASYKIALAVPSSIAFRECYDDSRSGQRVAIVAAESPYAHRGWRMVFACAAIIVAVILFRKRLPETEFARLSTGTTLFATAILWWFCLNPAILAVIFLGMVCQRIYRKARAARDGY